MKLIVPLFLVFSILLFKKEILDLFSTESTEVEDPFQQDVPTEGITFQDLERRRKETETRARMARDQANLRKMVSKPIRGKVSSGDESGFVIDVDEHAVAGTEDHGSLESQTLDAEINKLLAERQLMDEMTEERKSIYAQNFIEKARGMGFEIKMDRDYQIISVKKLKRP